jgi:hypothetical protein
MRSSLSFLLLLLALLAIFLSVPSQALEIDSTVSISDDADDANDVAISPKADLSNYSYIVFLYNTLDSQCTNQTGKLLLDTNTCNVVSTQFGPFNSVTIRNASTSAQPNLFALDCFFESSLCDDFVGLYQNGTVSTCLKNQYFNYMVYAPGY